VPRFVSQRVYLQLFIVLALGIAIGFRWPLPSQMLLHDGLWIWLLIAGLGALAVLWRSDPRPVALVTLYCMLAIAGILSVSLTLHSALDAPLRSVAHRTDYLRGTVGSIPKYQKGHWRFLLDVDRARVDGEWQAAPGRVFAYLKGAPESKIYFRERITLRAAVKEELPPPNRGQFNYRRYLLQRGTVLTAYAPSDKSLHHLGDQPPQPWAALSALREHLLGAVTRHIPSELGQLAASVTYGDKVTELPEDLQERFRRAGLTHILVASGTQISLLITVLALLLWQVGDNATWRGRCINVGKFMLTLGAVLAYGAVTGFETSIVRALVMGVVVLVGQITSREVDGMTALAQAGLALLLLNPLELLAPGFQLSFGATFGLIYAAGVCFPMTQLMTGWRKALAQMLVTTAGAQLFVAPILAAQFNQLSLWGLLSNFLAIPLAFALLIIGGISSLGLAYVPLLGTVLQWTVLALSWLLNTVAAVFAALPGSSIAVPTPPLWWLLAGYALIFLAGEWIKSKRGNTLNDRQTRLLKALTPALATLLLVPAMLWLIVPRAELIALALHNGEAYIWRAPDGSTTLYVRKTGLSRSHNADTVVSALRCRGINKLSRVVWIDSPGDTQLLADYASAQHSYDPSFEQVATNACCVQPQYSDDAGLNGFSVHGRAGSATVTLPSPTEVTIDMGHGEPRIRELRMRGP
jgi:competence protein ComEC